MDNNQVKYAGFWVRAIALTIDTLIFLGIFFGLAYILIIMGIFDSLTSFIDYYQENLIFIPVGILTILLFAKFVSSKWQASPGKRLMNIHVIDLNGGRLSFLKAIFRYVLPFFILTGLQNIPIYESLSQTMFLLAIWIPTVTWYGIAGITKQKTTLHDIICKTRVIYGKPDKHHAN